MGAPIKRVHWMWSGVIVLGLCGLALARTPDIQRSVRAAVLQAVLDCRVVEGPTPRLECFDRSVARLAEAEASGQIVVIDREQAQAVRREAFGFNLPKLSLFSRGAKGEDIDRVTLAVTSAHRAGDGRWIVEVEGGGVWRQIDGEAMAPPGPGAKAEIRKASLGSYFMSIDGRRSIRVERQR
jgi:hypothetical protein